MGYGSYSYEAHQAITRSRQKLPTQEVFSQRDIHPLMDPHGVKVRESRDSEEHPESLGIVFALDVSGSMGAIPEALARRELPHFMKTLLDCGVQSPQVLFMAFADAYGGRMKAPLQVGQFETTAELMDQWLTRCWLTGGGASQYESYDLAMYFAAHHTAMDCWEKRRHRGYFFMTGDEESHRTLDAEHVQRVIGDQIPADIAFPQVVAELRETFEPFFLIPDPRRAERIEAFWRDHLGQRAIAMSSPEDTCAVAGGIVAIAEKRVDGLDGLARQLESHGYEPERVRTVTGALEPWAKTL